MCNQPATSREHAPPKCIFPEQKDNLGGNDYRKNLISVPACTAHNQEKSGDDELMLYILALSITSGDAAAIQLETKVARATSRNPSLLSWIASHSVPISICVHADENVEEGLAIQIDMRRFDAAVAHTVRALYFHETGRKFLGPIDVKTPFAPYLSYAEHNREVLQAVFRVEQFLSNQLARGENSEVFSYKLHESARYCIMLLTFYGETKVLARLDKRHAVSE
jgi:hypothetical protein